MALRYFEYRKGRIEIIPMIDVMLFLLVFFIIVTLQMIPDAGINLQLPQSSQAKHLPHPKVTVNLLADGSIHVKGATFTPEALTALLAGDGNPAKTQVTIAADKDVAFQHFVAVMDAARKAGVNDIGVAAQPGGTAGGAGAGAPATAGGGSAGLASAAASVPSAGATPAQAGVSPAMPSAAAQPSAAQPSAAQPSAAQPSAAQPSAGQPSAGQSAAAAAAAVAAPASQAGAPGSKP